MKLKRRVLAVLLTLAVMVTFMPFISQQAYAAGSSKVQVVTKAKSNNGNTSYTYNKKGLVSKSVYKSSSKDNDSDSTYTETTTYKYNKKNKVAKKTETDVHKVTYYATDKTTGKTRTANLGTVTYTTKYVTVFTYNKKGLAKKSVTTKTFTQSGSTTDAYKNRRFQYYSDYELTDGRIIAGYNIYDTSGKYIDYYDRSTSANAYYYTGAINDAVKSGVYTSTYRDNGDGSYTEVSDNNVSRANYDTKPIIKYYMHDENGNVVECAEEDSEFYIISAENVVLDPTNDSTETSHWESTHQDKSVTTTTYSYKKGRVSKKVATTVNTKVDTDVTSTTTEKDSKGTRTTVNNTPWSKTEVETTTVTTTYTYDKKGRAKQSVTSNNGVINKTTTTVYGLPNVTTTEKDGKTTSEVGSGAACASTNTVQIANGTQTTTNTPNKYMLTTTNSDGTTDTIVENENAKVDVKTSVVRATPSKTTYKYTYDKNSNIKKVASSGSKTEEVELKNEVFVDEDEDPIYLYEFNSEGRPIIAKTVISHSSKSTTNKETYVKDGTKRLNKSLSMGTTSYDGSKSSGYNLDERVVYTLKAKKLKSSLAKLAEQQQWIIQNGALNGVVGLN